jgi:small nuclear ribonucleoprotein (snRNP)-like protein
MEAFFDHIALSDAHSANKTSPIAYVRGFMGKQIAAALFDGRVITGVLVALDNTACVTIKNATEGLHTNKGRNLGDVICSLYYICVLELRE